jgi:LysM repeat protein
MLMSGNGRHRKQRQPPTAALAVAATGAGIVLPLLTASGAQAADTSTWTKVAQCESGGLWSSNTGNGFYGGLQISQETWVLYGGTQFAPRPDLASMSEQISVAQKMLTALGPDAWPGCAQPAGLPTDTATPSLDLGTILKPASPPAPTPIAAPTPTVTPTPTPSASSASTPAASPAGIAPFSSSASPVNSASPTPSATGGSTKGSTVGNPSGAAQPTVPSAATQLPSQSAPLAPSTAPQQAQSESSWGVLPSNGSGQAQPHAGLGTTTSSYRVREGDTLWGIAVAHGLDWTALYKANEGVIGDNPGLIHPGQYLDLG